MLPNHLKSLTLTYAPMAIFSYTWDGDADDVVESCVYLSTIIIYDFRTYAPTPSDYGRGVAHSPRPERRSGDRSPRVH